MHREHQTSNHKAQKALCLSVHKAILLLLVI